MSYEPRKITPHARQPGLIARLFGQNAAEDETAFDDVQSVPHAPRERLSDRDRFTMRHGALIEEVCTFLARAGLDPIPDHYELAWFYLTAACATQRLRIETVLLDKGGISPADASQLLDGIRTTIASADLEAMVEQARSDIFEARAATDRSSRDAADYGAALGGTLPTLSDPGQIAETLNRLQSLTRDMVDRAARAEAELKARSVAMGKMRSRLAQSQKQALSDALTGLPNRRAFDALLEKAIADARHAGRPLAVGFCDIDHFKAINDTHGHATGDRVIQHVADVLRKSSGNKCHVARHGGEEFALLFEGLDEVAARDRLDHARESLTSKRLVSRETQAEIGEVSFSGGVAMLASGDSASCLLSRADKALYEAKHLGRNQIRIAATPG